jgi:hypothetical protein
MIEFRTWYERSHGGKKIWHCYGTFLFGVILLKVTKRELTPLERAFAGQLIVCRPKTAQRGTGCAWVWFFENARKYTFSGIW